MRTRRWWTVPLMGLSLAALLLGGTRIPAQEHKANAPVERKDLDAAIYKVLRVVINQGADLYNGGDWAGCYHLYEGSLITLKPLLDHHPKLQAAIDDGLVSAARSPQLGDRAFVLRKVIDQVRDGTAPPAVSPPPPPPKTLWDRLGGEKTISRVVDQVLAKASTDPRINFWRKPGYRPSDKQVETLKKNFVDLISSLTGGPFDYKGKNMKDAHKNMGITNSEFDAFEGILRQELQIQGAQPPDVNLVLSSIETMRSDVVQPKVVPPPPPQTAWQRLGGEPGVAKIVDDFVGAAASDPAVNFFRDPKYTPPAEAVINLKNKIVAQISDMTGGPLVYKGLSMKQAHRTMGITNAEYDAFLGHVRKALETHKANANDIKMLMTKFNDMRKDIVGMTAPVDTIPKVEKKPEEKKEEEKKPVEKEDKKPEEKEEKKPVEKEDKKPIEKKEDEKKEDKKPDDKEPIKAPKEKVDDKEDKKPVEKEDKKPDDKEDKKPSDKKEDDKKPDDKEPIKAPKEKPDDKKEATKEDKKPDDKKEDAKPDDKKPEDK